MNIDIKKNFSIALYGFGGVAINRNWSATGMALMNKMWQEVKSRSLRHRGINVWVYEQGNNMFAGVELEASPEMETPLEVKHIQLPEYAYYKHTGTYDKIKTAGEQVLQELERKGIKTQLPYLEIYGHWTEDPSKLETELLWSLA